MASYLIVANQTLGGQRLADEVRRRADEGECRIYVVVPRRSAGTPADGGGGVIASGAQSSMPAGGVDSGRTYRGDDARDEAATRLKHALARFEELGVDEATGEVGDPDPLEAIAHAVDAAGPFDEIIVSTLPARVSRWLKMDLASRARRRFDAPVTHVEAEEQPTPE